MIFVSVLSLALVQATAQVLVGGAPECWSGDYTEAVCCDTRRGPLGNLACWNDRFTFSRCCDRPEAAHYEQLREDFHANSANDRWELWYQQAGLLVRGLHRLEARPGLAAFDPVLSIEDVRGESARACSYDSRAQVLSR